MDFFDTQILFYKFNDNKNSLDIESSAIKNNGQDNKGFVNNKWRLIRS